MINGKIVKAGFFDGIGGFDIAADWMGWLTAFHSELDPFCSEILKYYWPNAKNYGDITKADLSFWRGKIDVLTGGFPCQPFSHAGNRKGTNDNRYLWPQMCKGIDIIRPTFVIGENVTGILTMEDKSGVSKDVFFRVDSRKRTRLEEIDHYEAVYTRQSRMLLNNIIDDLEKIGYAVQTFVVPASATQAPHRRDRTWIVAYNNGTGLQEAGTQQQAARIEQYGKLDGHAPHPGSHEPRNKGLGETGSPAGAYKEEENQWQRLWAIATGNGHQTDVAHPQYDGRPTPQDGRGHGETGKRGKKGKDGTQQLTGICEPTELGSVQAYGNASNPKSRGNGRLRHQEKETGPQKSHEPFGKQHRISGTERDVANPASAGGRQDYGRGKPRQFDQEGEAEYWSKFPTQPPICGGNDGIPAQLHGIALSTWRNQSIKGYGNAVVPQVVLEFYKAIEIELLKIQAQASSSNSKPAT